MCTHFMCTHSSRNDISTLSGLYCSTTTNNTNFQSGDNYILNIVGIPEDWRYQLFYIFISNGYQKIYVWVSLLITRCYLIVILSAFLWLLICFHIHWPFECIISLQFLFMSFAMFSIRLSFSYLFIVFNLFLF